MLTPAILLLPAGGKHTCRVSIVSSGKGERVCRWLQLEWFILRENVDVGEVVSTYLRKALKVLIRERRLPEVGSEWSKLYTEVHIYWSFRRKELYSAQFGIKFCLDIAIRTTMCIRRHFFFWPERTRKDELSIYTACLWPQPVVGLAKIVCYIGMQWMQMKWLV